MTCSCNKYIFYIFIVCFHNAISSNPPSSQGEIEPLCDTHNNRACIFFLGKVATYKSTYYCFLIFLIMFFYLKSTTSWLCYLRINRPFGKTTRIATSTSTMRVLILDLSSLFAKKFSWNISSIYILNINLFHLSLQVD